jgi:hypothetical protein
MVSRSPGASRRARRWARYNPPTSLDRDTSLGNYSLAEFDNAVRRGVAKDTIDSILRCRTLPTRSLVGRFDQYEALSLAISFLAKRNNRDVLCYSRTVAEPARKIPA